MPPSDNRNTNAIPAAFVLAFAGVLCIPAGAALAWLLPSAGAWTLTYLGGIGLIGGIAAWLKYRLKTLADTEAAAEKRRLETTGAQIFESDLMTGEHQRTYAGFEKYGTRITAFLMILTACAGAVQMFTAAPMAKPQFSNVLLLISGLGVFALLITGRIIGALFRDCPFLRTASGLTVLQGLILLVIAGCGGITRFTVSNDLTFESADAIIAATGGVILVLLALDFLLGLLLSFYRSTTPDGIEAPSACESRLAALLAGSGNFSATLRDLLEYQFGIRWTREELTRLAIRYLVPIIILEFVLLGATSMLTVIPEGSVGYIEQFGVFTGKTYASGIHFKAPWPIAQIRVVPTGIMETLTIGAPMEKEQLWRSYNTHTDKTVGYGTFQLTAYPNPNNTFSEDVIEATLAVTYTVDSPREFFIVHANGRTALAQLAWKQFLLAMTATSNHELLNGSKTIAVCNRIREHLQDEIACSELGVTLRSVSFAHLQPPSIDAVAGAFRRRGETLWQAQTALAEAQGNAKRLLAGAQVETQKIRSAARVDAANMRTETTANAAVFAVRASLLKQFGTLYRDLLALDALEKAYLPARKLFIAIQDPALLERIRMSLDLKDDTGPTFLDAANH